MAENEPRPWALAFFLALAPLIFLAWRFDFLVDDAFISFRYAQNLAAGHGLVFNPGEEPRVEGYTNFLWTLTLAGVQALGLDPAIWARALSLVSAAALLALVTRFLARNVFDGMAPAAMGAVFFATLPPISVWATGGLETMPFALAVFAVFERLLGDQGRPHAVQAGLAGAAAVLLRADGFVWVGIALAAAAVFQSTDRPRLWRAVLTAGALAGVVSAAHFLWRQSYYGEWLPNTSRAKVHLGALALERGGLYVASMLLAIPSIPIALLHALGCLRARRAVVGPALVAVLGGFGYVAVVGGDWMMMYRMLVPTLPFVAVAFGAVLATIRDRTVRRVLFGASVVLSLLPAFDRHPVPGSVRELAHFRWGQDYRTEYAVWKKGVDDIEEWILLGKALRAHTAPGESIMPQGRIGAIPFYSGLIAYDTLGLTNREPFAPVPEGDDRRLPGHERTVDIGYLRDKYRPTYRGALIAPADDPFAELPQAWTDPSHPLSKELALETRPLDPSQGFPEESVLVLIRNRW